MKNFKEKLAALTTAILIGTFLFPFTAVAAGPNSAIDPSSANKLSEDQKIIHVLNRLGFGARAGDVEKVRAIGIRRYIEIQLEPAEIDDSAADARVKPLDIFSMSSAEVFAKYPIPGELLRQTRADIKMGQTPDTAAAEKPMSAEIDRKERQAKLAELYSEFGFRPAGQIGPQIIANRVLRAAYSERQLQEVMVDFWQNHFNVYSGKNPVRWYIPSYERDVLRPKALGNFKDLLIATAQHPAMLLYLDNFQSAAPPSEQNIRGRSGNKKEGWQKRLAEGSLSPKQRENLMKRRGLDEDQVRALSEQAKKAAARPRVQRGINENYARELMELHTMGVGSGYTQNDVVEVAKALTGWTVSDPRGYQQTNRILREQGADPNNKRMRTVRNDNGTGNFFFNERTHVKGPKHILGRTIDSGGVNDGLAVMELLVAQPATAKFIARKLAVRFVNDDPDEAYVGRIAKAFQESKGDIKTTLRALFLDPEFFATQNYRSKIKTPFELAISSVRALDADTNASPAFIGLLNKLGEVPYGYLAPTGYSDRSEDWVNTGALLERLNFAVAIASNRIPGTRVDLAAYKKGDPKAVLNSAISEILNGEVSPQTRTMLEKQMAQALPEPKPGIEPTSAEEQPIRGRGRVANQTRLKGPSGDPTVFKAVSLVLGSPEFQRQ